MGFDFPIANAWLACVSQMSQSKGLGMREAAWEVAEQLKLFTECCNLENIIAEKKHQIELLDMAAEDKKEVFAALVDLRKQNIGGREILEVMESINSKKNNGHDSSFEPDTDMDLPQQESDNNQRHGKYTMTVQ
jgi:hypothetical protein